MPKTDCFSGSRKSLIQQHETFLSLFLLKSILMSRIFLHPSGVFTSSCLHLYFFVSLHHFMSSLLYFIYITILTILCSSHKSWTWSWDNVLNLTLTWPPSNLNLFMSTLFSSTCTIFLTYKTQLLTYYAPKNPSASCLKTKNCCFLLPEPLCTGVFYTSRNTVILCSVCGVDHIVKQYKTTGSVTDVYSNCQHFEI
jgi:hypothetical protein